MSPKIPSNTSYICFKCRITLESLNPKFLNCQNFLAVVVGVEDDDSEALIFQATTILENCCFSPSSDMEYSIQMGNR